MSADNLSNISTALATTFAPQLVRAWNRQSVVLQNLKLVSGGGQGGGKQVGWDVQFSGQTAAAFAEGSDVDPSEYSNDVEKPATLPWGQYRATFKLSNLEMNAASANMGNAVELEKILEERFFGAITKITSKMNYDAIQGTGADGSSNPTLVGLLTAADATTQYAGLSKVSYPEWAGNVSANSGTPRALTMALLAAAEQAQFVSSGMSSTMLLTSAGVKTKYEGLFQSVFRTFNDGTAPIKSFNGSSEDLFWRGRPIVRDKDMPAGYLMGLNPEEVEMRILPWAPVPDGIPTNLRELMSSNGKDAAALGSFVHVYPLGRKGSAITFVAEIYAQLKVKRPNQHFIIKDINEA